MLFQFFAKIAITAITPAIAAVNAPNFKAPNANLEIIAAKSMPKIAKIADNDCIIDIIFTIPLTNSINFQAAKNATTATVIFSTNVWF